MKTTYDKVMDEYLKDIIKLQLRKPKNWNWELSTSKSSPHIALPIIQLYNSKGQLLVETKDTGKHQRRSWHSSEQDRYITEGFKEETIPQNLQRCKSDVYRDIFCANKISINNYESIKRKIDVEEKLNGSWHNVLENRTKHIYSKDADGFNENRKWRGSCENVISAVSETNKGRHHLQKSRSDVLHKKNHVKVGNNEPKTFVECFKLNSLKSNRSLGEFERKTQLKTFTNHHRRTKSDDLFNRTMKYNEESIRRAIADGYRNFITPRIPTSVLECDDNIDRTNDTSLSNNYEDTDESPRRHRRYEMRTSSAGTLIISRESFNCLHHRRRHRLRDENDKDKNTTPSTFSCSKQDNERTSSTNTIRNGTSKHTRQSSDPTSSRTSAEKLFTKIHPDRYTSVDGNLTSSKQEREKKKTSENSLFHTNDKTFPVEEICNFTPDDKCNENSTYTVQEPMSSDNKNCTEGNNAKIKMERKKRRKFRKQHNDDSTSSSTMERKNQLNGEGNKIKGRILKGHKKEINGDDSDLLRLVRQLSTDHVKMGANVSRHSSKGLSGRRSQSSGSICNGKGRHGNNSGETKMCGSLPSYLDERETNGCNNNHHDCEKPPLDEVQRIPPLGDGAPLHWKFSDNQTALCDQGYGSERSPEEEYPPPLPEHDNPCHHHLEAHACYPFITPESTFAVTLAKGSRGLGLSVTGGIDSGGSWPGLIRVKRLFPHQPAAACGLLNVGDLLLEANGITLTGLTNYEALEVLRTTPNQVELKVCRPPPDVLSCVSPISEVPPPPPRREPPTSLNLPSAMHNTPEDDYYHGDFEVTLTKIQGSLGFTLRKEDDSALGHYVRALVREPALTDGRIRAGDKIIAVNDVEISPMSHEQAVQFLRQCGDVVKLRLYRDASQTPVAALSPTETTPRTSFSRKAHLRQEAVDMLNDIAVRKLIPGNHDVYRRSLSPNSSPRRLRRQACPSDASHMTDPCDKYLITDEQFHEGLLQKCSLQFDDESFNSLFSVDSDECDRPSRPSSLDLYNPNRTPVAARKPKFNFSLAHNAYELNNLDPEVLDAPNLTYNLGNEEGNSTEVECGDSFPQEPVSMPHIPSEKPGFSYKNPAYQSAHPQCGSDVPDDKMNGKVVDDSSMKKWKGVVFNADEENPEEVLTIKDDCEILAIELNRGWNSRLGFSLQGAAGVTYVSAVHSDSVAARDGRLKPGDRVIKVNDESVEHMSTNEIIDLLRIVRGPVCIVVCRTKSKEDCTKSNAAN